MEALIFNLRKRSSMFQAQRSYSLWFQEAFFLYVCKVSKVRPLKLIYLSIYLFTYLSIYLSIYLSCRTMLLSDGPWNPEHIYLSIYLAEPCCSLTGPGIPSTSTRKLSDTEKQDTEVNFRKSKIKLICQKESQLCF